MSKKKWERQKCNGCKFFNPECRQGACGIYPYKRKILASKKEVYDTS